MSTITDYERADIYQISVHFIDGEVEFLDNALGGTVEELEQRIDNMFVWNHWSGAIECVRAQDVNGDQLAELSADAYFGRTKQDYENGNREGF